MNTNSRLILEKEFKILLERKKIIIYFIVGILFPTIMGYVFNEYGSIFPVKESIILMYLFVSMLSAEFLFISLAEETNYNMLNILLIGAKSKFKLFIYKSFFSFCFTIAIVILSALVHDIIMPSIHMNVFSLLRLDVLAISIFGIVISMLGEWMCMLYIGEYNVNSHSIVMIISYGVVLLLYYLKSKLNPYFTTTISLILIIFYTYVVIRSLKLRDGQKTPKLYFKNLFNHNIQGYLISENLVAITELRTVNYLFIKIGLSLLIPLFYPLICKYFNIFNNIEFSQWILLYIFISLLCNSMIFPSSFNRVKYGIDIINKINHKSNLSIIFIRIVSYVLLMFSYELVLYLLIALFKIEISSSIFILLIVSSLINYFIGSILGLYVKNIKDYKMLNLLSTSIGLIVHACLFVI